jgi:hypothetical protein
VLCGTSTSRRRRAARTQELKYKKMIDLSFLYFTFLCSRALAADAANEVDRLHLAFKTLRLCVSVLR